MNSKLKNITTRYRKFNEHQVLTEGQLNEFIDYFEDQSRLSRTRLSGVGIVCGFRIELGTQDYAIDESTTGSRPVVKLFQGAGVTTDGDLVTLQNRIGAEDSIDAIVDILSQEYTHYKTYDDTLKYPHFWNADVQVPLTELRTESEADESFTQLTDAINLDDKVMILYLESYSNEESPCEDADCDNQGAEQISKLRVLFTDAISAGLIAEGTTDDDIYNTHNAFEELYENLADIVVPRVILDPSITTKEALGTKFQDVIEKPGIIDDLSNGFYALAQQFNIDTGTSQNATQISQAIRSHLITTENDFQYRYDGLKDLVTTYSEIKAMLFDLKSECCPDIYSFPKHLMLGQMGATYELAEKIEFRHDFYKSPVITDEDENQEKARLLIERFVEQMQNFITVSGSVKITPSRYIAPLGDKAIPYYYTVTERLLNKWNYVKTKTEKSTYNLSYHVDQLSSHDFIQNPLSYNIDHNDFYRIEGHLGESYRNAYENIIELRDRYGLSFDVKAVFLREEVSDDNTVPEEVSIKDLRDQLRAISNKFDSKSVNDRQITMQSFAYLDRKLDALNNLQKNSVFKNSLSDQSTSALRAVDQSDSVARPAEDASQFVSSGDSANQYARVHADSSQLTHAPTSETATFLTASNTSGHVAQLPTTLITTAEEEKIKSILLADFMEQHTGMEHMGGVQPGGTFVLIYESEKNNTVIADFTLPYLCCAKKEPAVLVLPESCLCPLDAPMPLTIFPLDGEVKVLDGTTNVENTIQVNDGQVFFVPSAVPTALHGKLLSFTVNGEAIDKQLTVGKLPDINITVDPDIVYDNDNNTAQVTFEVDGGEGVVLSDYGFTIDYGDGSSIEQMASGAGANTMRIPYTYNIDPDKDDTYHPEITITDKQGCQCSKKVSLEVEVSALTVSCNQTFNFSGNKGTFEYFIDFGTGTGTAGIDYNAYGVPDNFTIEWNGQTYTSGYVGSNRYNGQLSAMGIPSTEIRTGSPSTGSGQLRFNKSAATPSKAKVTVKAPFPGTAWNIKGVCPGGGSQSGSGSVSGSIGSVDAAPSGTAQVAGVGSVAGTNSGTQTVSSGTVSAANSGTVQMSAADTQSVAKTGASS